VYDCLMIMPTTSTILTTYIMLIIFTYFP